jgi:membrane associated rhomboid family serine protease
MKLIEALRKPFPYKNYNITIALIIINVIIFILTYLWNELYVYLALIPRLVIKQGYFWQVFTYMFVHSNNNIYHIIFNMLGLYMFGTTLEQRLGSFEFLAYYIFCGTATGLVLLLFNNPVVGASGAIFAVLLAFATLFPEARILLFFFIPLKAPQAVLVFAGLSIFFLFTDTMPNVSHLGHLSGIIFGFLYLLARLNINPLKVFFSRNKYRY